MNLRALSVLAAGASMVVAGGATAQTAAPAPQPTAADAAAAQPAPQQPSRHVPPPFPNSAAPAPQPPAVRPSPNAAAPLQSPAVPAQPPAPAPAPQQPALRPNRHVPPPFPNPAVPATGRTSKKAPGPSGAPAPTSGPASTAQPTAASVPAGASQPPTAAGGPQSAAAPSAGSAALVQPSGAAAPTAEPAATPGAEAPAAQTGAEQGGPYGPPPPAGGWTRPAEPPPPGNPYPTYRQRRRWSREEAERLRRMLEVERARRAAWMRERRPLDDPYGASSGPITPRVRGDAGAAVTVGLSADTIFHDDIGFRHFDNSDANGRFGAFGGYDLLTLAPKWILSGELGFGVEKLEGDARLRGVGRVELLTWTLFGGLNLRWDACSFLAPQLRLSAGASVGELELAPIDSSTERDSASSGFGALGVGFLLHTPARSFETPEGKLASLTFGVLVELGYALRSSMDFALRSQNEANRIEVAGAKLGRLDLSGPYLRTALVTRF